MLGSLLKLLAYSQAPKTTFVVRHPIVSAQLAKTPFDLRTAYAPRIVAVAAALLVAPLAYRLGKRAGQGTLLQPKRALPEPAAEPSPEPSPKPRDPRVVQSAAPAAAQWSRPAALPPVSPSGGRSRPRWFGPPS